MIDMRNAIPHRPPFLFVDEVVSLDEKKIVATVTMGADRDFFKGHYPAFPVTPGVIVTEAVVQAGAILLSHSLGDGIGKKVPLLTRLKDVKFKSMVRPGDTITLTAEIEEILGSAFYMKGSAKVDGKMAATVLFTCALADIE
jgi:3-hydroxyacyl-[acyl-carrier-protein] dehydratase